MPKGLRLALLLALSFSGGCTVTGAAFSYEDEPGFQTSLAVRASPNRGGAVHGWRVGADRYALNDDVAWGASGDLLIPVLEPGYLIGGLGLAGEPLRWSATLGLGTELDMREPHYHWGVLVEGGTQVLGFDDRGAQFTEIVFFVRLGAYFCHRPMPC